MKRVLHVLLVCAAEAWAQPSEPPRSPVVPAAEQAASAPRWDVPPDAPAAPRRSPGKASLASRQASLGLTVVVPVLLVDATGRVICATRLAAALRVGNVPDGAMRETTLQTGRLALPVGHHDTVAGVNACAQMRLSAEPGTFAPASQLR